MTTHQQNDCPTPSAIRPDAAKGTRRVWNAEFLRRRLLHLHPKRIRTPPNPNGQNEESGKGLGGDCCRMKHQLVGKGFQRVWVFPVGMVNQSFAIPDNDCDPNYCDLYCNKLR